MDQMQTTTLAYRFAETLNTQDIAAFDDFIVAEYVNHNSYAAPGRAGMKALFTNWLEAFPDTHVTVEDALGVDDKVIGRFTYRGTHRAIFFPGSPFGVAPTGRVITIRSIDIWRVENGKIVEHWDELNLLDVAQQLGISLTDSP